MTAAPTIAPNAPSTAASGDSAPVRKRRYRHHANPLNVRGPIEVPDWTSVYDQPQPLALDIGFGEGCFLLALAQKHPEWNVLGLEIRPHLVADVNTEIAGLGLPNAHAMLANANLHLTELVPDDSVAFVAINFPDPWFKKRHHKRRVVQPDWLPVLLPKLKTGAHLHIMSDYEPIAEHMRDVIEAHGAFTNVSGTGNYAESTTTGLTTEREQKHMGRGHPVYRLCFEFHGP